MHLEEQTAQGYRLDLVSTLSSKVYPILKNGLQIFRSDRVEVQEMLQKGAIGTKWATTWMPPFFAQLGMSSRQEQPI